MAGSLKRLRGVLVPLVTPFDAAEAVDFRALRSLVRYLVENGVHGLYPAGTQGEFFALSQDERKAVAEAVIEEAGGRVPVIPNVGAVTTREAIALARHAEGAGADAISVVTPYFIGPTQEELYTHFRAVAESVSLPVLAYNIPPRTGVNLQPETVARLAADCPNLVGVKDSSGDLTQTLDYACLTGPEFRVFVGRDTLIYAGIASGCVGAVAATANMAPQLVVELYEATARGDHARGVELQRQVGLLRSAMGLGTFPVVAKEALALLGRIPDGRARRPVQPLSPAAREELRAALVAVGVLKP
ncbi:MAG: 4-hydroxy-tetrahydrodipicolinate synthase [Anaerolineae bacterium]